MLKTLLLCLLLPAYAMSQHMYQVNDIPVQRNGNLMQNPWVGGLNNPVFSPIDLNQDGLMDLFVYDKAGWKALAFLNTGSNGNPSFTYAPQYDLMFPPELHDWAVIRDYNRDGVPDIMALSPIANTTDIAVYKGYRAADGFLSFQLTYPDLRYPFGVNGPTNMWTFADNMPVMMDIDGDGDLDILAPNVNGGVSLDYYINQQVDSGWSTDSMVFLFGGSCWGLFNEDVNDCGVALQQCPFEISGPQVPGYERDLRHQGGACCGFHYHPGSPIVSLFIADIYCNTLKLLENTGRTDSAIMTYCDTTFPHYDVPVNIPLFPCAYELDADNDGYTDLFISPFASNASVEGQSEDISVVNYYHNIGIDTVNKYHFMGDTIMTNGIIDVGTESHPVFFDHNGDSLMDIVIGNYGRFETNGYPMSSLALYENTGSATAPQYNEVTLDWDSLSQYSLHGIYPAFGDLDGDGHPDMVIGDAYGDIHFFHNAGGSTASYPVMTGPYWFGINMTANAAPFIYDVNGDGLNDLVIGSKGNNIAYYWNFGTRTNPMFSPDSVNLFFGDIEVYDYHIGVVPGYATPFITKENGSTVLYSGSQGGSTFKFAVDPAHLRSGAFAILDTNVLGINPGQRSTISIADINHDGHNDYLAGSIRGGVTIYSDVNWGNEPVISGIANPISGNELAVFPNPAKDNVICRVPGLASVSLYNMLGEQVTVPENNPEAGTIILTVDRLPDGIYVLQAKDNQNRLYQRKIAIFK